ncbi:hypothetical protein NP493_532g03044 [Ridgeia piscesae]|uniref:Uncharacterized protein n=1 Tax=Ridgeia piscesae TaxID=27915 RepID=A0AAD9KW85_RIDPI|nr:hypothetical protein NP493_532g03044 [Ridgeia piscesae]
MDWTPHEDVTRHKQVVYSQLTVFWSQKERAPSSPVQGYHQEKPNAEIHIKTHGHHSHNREINGEQ